MIPEPALERSPTAVAPDPAAAALREVLERCANGLVSVCFRDGRRAGWMSWDLAADGQPVGLRAGNLSLYDGDLGAGWACADLGVVLDRDDLVDLALDVAAAAVAVQPSLPAGLLSGGTGVALAVRHISQVTGVPIGGQAALVDGFDGLDPQATDLTSGAAGLLLGDLTRDRAGEALGVLEDGARREAGGWCWPEAGSARALCGLAHGNSGVVLAAAEAAARHDDLVDRAGELVRNALRWERCWFDPVRGRWPDLRADEPTYPALWCHGAAGIGLVRLRLLALAEQGLDLGLCAEDVRVEAEVAVQACGQELEEAVAAARELGPGVLGGGLTLCHGFGGPLDVLVSAHRIWGVDEHLAAARALALDLTQLLGDEPLHWPAGIPASGSCGLFLGLGGVAAVLARAASPDVLPSPGLLGLGG